jgi:cyclic pyranopterin phosphate synthase
MWYRCLYATNGTDLRKLLRGAAADANVSREAADAEIANVIAEGWRGREDRGAEERASRNDRGALIAIEELRRDPHLEMHTRGG